MIKKILVYKSGHHKVMKNLFIGLEKFKQRGKLEYSYSSNISDFETHDIIYSSSPLDIHKYPKNKFILGPNICDYPCKIMDFDNSNKNAIYVVSSQWFHDFVKMFDYNALPIRVIPTGIDTEYFKPDKPQIARTDVFIYYKPKFQEQFDKFIKVKEMLNKKSINYTIIEYGKYTEEQYISTLLNAKYGIWVGVKETQGIALQEALSTDVPLFVWNSKYKFNWSTIDKQNKYHVFQPKMNVIEIGGTVTYWDATCGYVLDNDNELETQFDQFLINLYNYSPRNYIVNNLSIEKWIQTLIDLW